MQCTSFIYGIKNKRWRRLFTEQNRLTDIENRLVVAKGKGFGKDMDWQFGSAEANYSVRDG